MSADIERVYLATSGELSFAVDASAETVWATHQQIADLFGVDRSGATRHINNGLATEEVGRTNNVQKMHIQARWGDATKPTTCKDSLQVGHAGAATGGGGRNRGKGQCR